MRNLFEFFLIFFLEKLVEAGNLATFCEQNNGQIWHLRGTLEKCVVYHGGEPKSWNEAMEACHAASEGLFGRVLTFANSDQFEWVKTNFSSQFLLEEHWIG